MRPAICHSDKWQVAHGLCQACYHRAWVKAEIGKGSDERQHCEKHPDRIVRAKGKCASCYSHRNSKTKAYKDKAYSYSLKYNYGITFTQFQSIFDQQNGMCVICARGNIRLIVDHDHETKQIRGLICVRCNIMLGYIETTSTEIYERAMKYIHKHIATK